MSKRSITRILDTLADQKKQEEIRLFEDYVRGLKIGDLLSVKSSDVICEVRFTDDPTSCSCKLNLLRPASKHLVEIELDHVFYDRIDRNGVYNCLILEKGLALGDCVCFFLIPSYVTKRDFIVLLDDRLYYIRLPWPGCEDDIF